MELNLSGAEANGASQSNPLVGTGRLTRILVADDHESVRRGIGELIKTEPGFELSGEAANGFEAVEKARQLKPDVAVLDMSMPRMNGLEAARKITKESPSVEVMILTVHDSELLIEEVLTSGAHAYMLKSDVGQDLLAAIDSLSRRRPFFTTKVAKMVLNGYLESSARAGGSREDLTPRERQVIQLLAEGKSSKEVAVIQGIAVKTAETHRTNLMRKLGLHSICDLVHYA
ncbi:MAG: response regulator, partial [Terriglobia bacterium]